MAVGDDLTHVAEFLSRSKQNIRIARLVPSDPDAAPLTFAFISYPGVVVHAGLLQDFVFPVCDCDTCDDTAQRMADELEWTVLAVATGRFREHYRAGLAPRFGMPLESADGQGKQSSDTLAADIPNAILANARKRMKTLPDGWKPWPRR